MGFGNWTGLCQMSRRLWALSRLTLDTTMIVVQSEHFSGSLDHHKLSYRGMDRCGTARPTTPTSPTALLPSRLHPSIAGPRRVTQQGTLKGVGRVAHGGLHTPRFPETTLLSNRSEPVGTLSCSSHSRPGEGLGTSPTGHAAVAPLRHERTVTPSARSSPCDLPCRSQCRSSAETTLPSASSRQATHTQAPMPSKMAPCCSATMPTDEPITALRRLSCSAIAIDPYPLSASLHCVLRLLRLSAHPLTPYGPR